MASSQRTETATASTANTPGAAARAAANAPVGAARPGDQEGLAGHAPGSVAGTAGSGSGAGMAGSVAATPIDQATISCLSNAQYHSCREAFLDTVHRWFMFFVIALGAAALTDAFPKLLHAIFRVSVDPTLFKEACAAGAAVLAALDLTFDLSNRARSHAMMKRRYYELLADLREGHTTPEEVSVCLEKFSADEEPVYRVLYLICWNAAQRTVYGEKALRFNISLLGTIFKNWWRRPAAHYSVSGG
jgi:hypothetical protein